MPTDISIHGAFANMISLLEARIAGENEYKFRRWILTCVAGLVSQAYALFVDSTRRESQSADMGQHN